MKQRTAAPRGTFDILPTQSGRWQALERIIDEVCGRFGYREIRTPLFESVDVFARTIGEGTDIVDKEMYTFTDRGGRMLALRPEFTAPVVRAALEHGLLAAQPLKVYYRGAIFRYERPQRGRYRQSHQWGVECFGVAGPEADAEIIALGLEVMRDCGITDYLLEINSMGCDRCRSRFRDALIKYLKPRTSELSEANRARFDANPLRILDSKDPQDKALLANAPTVNEFLCEECRAHFDAVRDLLARLKISSTLNPHIVRGLDYYTRTVFEISSQVLGAQNAVCGGGRYDNLVAQMGGPPTPGVGLAMGMDRLLIVAEAAGGIAASEGRAVDGRARLDVAFVALDPASLRLLVPVMHALRTRGIAADTDYGLRKIDKQLRAAGDSGARLAVIVGGDELASGEATLQDLATRQRERVKLAEVEDVIARRLQAMSHASG